MSWNALIKTIITLFIFGLVNLILIKDYIGVVFRIFNLFYIYSIPSTIMILLFIGSLLYTGFNKLK